MAEDIDVISFAHDSPVLSQISLKFVLHLLTPSSPNFAPKWPTPG